MEAEKNGIISACKALHGHIVRHGKNFWDHMKKHHTKYLIGFGGGLLVFKGLAVLVAGRGIFDQIQGTKADFEDITPDPIVFDAVSQAELSTEYSSNTVSILGIDTGIIVSAENGLISINGGEFTGIALPAFANDTLQVKLTSSSQYTSSTLATVTVGDTPYMFSITTKDAPIQEQQQQQGSCQTILTNPIPGTTVRGVVPISFTLSGCTISSGTNYLVKINNILVGTASVAQDSTEYTTSLNANTTFITTGYLTDNKIIITKADNSFIYTGDAFVIDNQWPNITGITLVVNGANAGYVNVSGSVVLSFTADKNLTGNIVTILGWNATLTSQSGNIYTYTRQLTTDNTEWNITYNIVYKDTTGNTGYTEWFQSVIFDKTSANITGFIFTGNSTGITFGFQTNEPTKYNFTYGVSWSSNLTMLQQTLYATGNVGTLGLLNKTSTYNFTLAVYDVANNVHQVTGYFYFDTAGNVRYMHSLILASSWVTVSAWFTPNSTTWIVSTGTNSGNTAGWTLSQRLKNEILKYTTCKSDISFTPMTLDIEGIKVTINMPKFTKSSEQKIVSAFTVVLTQRLQEQNLSQEQLNEIVKKFDNFLVVLKLIRDDDNDCKQTLTTYHIEQFKKKLAEYNLIIE